MSSQNLLRRAIENFIRVLAGSMVPFMSPSLSTRQKSVLLLTKYLSKEKKVLWFTCPRMSNRLQTRKEDSVSKLWTELRYFKLDTCQERKEVTNSILSSITQLLRSSITAGFHHRVKVHWALKTPDQQHPEESQRHQKKVKHKKKFWIVTERK